MIRFFALIFCLCGFVLFCQAQTPTVGLLDYQEASFDGYTLFAPSTNSTTYLIDNCGRTVKSWESTYFRCTAAYLTNAGQLLRCGVVPSNFNAGGTAGQIELFDWTGDLDWSYTFSDSTYHQHHDVKPLPNGNILLFVWVLHSKADALAQGRNPNRVLDSGLWAERILEIKPIGNNAMEVVWQWDVWDHLVQDFDATKPNFGIVKDNPQLFDLNYVLGNGQAQLTDWLHFNGIDYNPTLEQIVVSSRTWCEIFVLDHSTTTAQAAGHSGGATGKGGDILYRWGNPLTYQRGTESDQRFYGQHDVQWVPDGVPNAGKILVYNNGQGRPGGNVSSFDRISPPLLSDGNYAIESEKAFQPTQLDWTYTGAIAGSFYSPTTSGVQPLPNGNHLACLGVAGQFFEVEKDTQSVVWNYKNPVRVTGPVNQGDVVQGNSVFKIRRYAPDFEGFTGKDLNPGLPVELNPYASNCMIFTAAAELNTEQVYSIYPNPADASFYIKLPENSENTSLELYSSLGNRVYQNTVNSFQNIPIDVLSSGVYIVLINGRPIGKLLKK